MQCAKKGCYRAFCAEHKYDGQDAVSLMKKFQECDVQEAQRLKRKWEGKLEPSAFSLFCTAMKGSGLNGPELMKRFKAEKSASPGVNRIPSPVSKVQFGKLAFTPNCVATLRRVNTLDDLRTDTTQTGFKYIVYDNRATMPYSYCIKIGGQSVRSKAFGTPASAANAFLEQIREWLGEIDSSGTEGERLREQDSSFTEGEQKKNDGTTTYAIPKPPEHWHLDRGAQILVDVADEGWTPSVVKEVCTDGWFVVCLRTTTDSWDDWLNWQEENTEWKRSAIQPGGEEGQRRPVAVGGARDKPRRTRRVAHTVATRVACPKCKVGKGKCFRVGVVGHLMSSGRVCVAKTGAVQESEDDEEVVEVVRVKDTDGVEDQEDVQVVVLEAKAVCEEDADRDEEDMEAVEVVDVEVIWEDDSTNAETATDADVEAAEKPDQDGHEEVLRSLSEIRKVCAKILSHA